MMNKHNPVLCSKSPPTKLCSTSSPSDDLDKIINDLQDEFSSMNFEYQELKRHSEETTYMSLKHDLEKETDNVIQRMGVKRDQINKLRKLKVTSFLTIS